MLRNMFHLFQSSLGHDKSTMPTYISKSEQFHAIQEDTQNLQNNINYFTQILNIYIIWTRFHNQVNKIHWKKGEHMQEIHFLDECQAPKCVSVKI